MIRAFSYGGGVQSTAGDVVKIGERLRFGVVADIRVEEERVVDLAASGEDERVPYALKQGVELVELRRRLRDGSPESLTGRIDRTASSIPIPARGLDGAPFRRVCTDEFKVRVVDRELRDRSGGAETRTGLGITVDEIHRARNDRPDVEYPLLELGLFRDDCAAIIVGAGLPVPPKAVALERQLQARRAGKSPVFLTRYGRNLDEVVDDQLLLDLDDGCDSGFCMT